MLIIHVLRSHPESPERLKQIWAKLNALGLAQRCVLLPSRSATDDEIESVHTYVVMVLIYNLHTYMHINDIPVIQQGAS